MLTILKKKVTIILLCIFLIASLLRLWQLGSTPLAIDWDEAALGYNAYSILHTGKDEYAKSFPIILRSFDDYKPALYTYLIIPFLPIFGLSEISVRLPSAISGIFTVIITYFLVREIFSEISIQNKNISIPLALISAFLLAISPWHIQFSRVAFEANVGMAMNVLGALLFLKALKRPPLLILSAIVFGLNLYVYQSEKVFTPLLVLFLVFLSRKELFSLPKKYIVTAMIFGLLAITPLVVFSATNKEVFSRAQGVSFLSDKTPLLRDTIEKLIQDKKQNDILGLFVDNRRIVYLKTILAGYLSHFDINWLFLKGDFIVNRHHAPSMGLLYLIELPFLFIGLYMLLLRSKELHIDERTKLFLFIWILLVPVPASVSTGVPHAVRTLNFLPTFQIVIALGMLISFFRVKEKIKNISLKVLLCIFFLSFAIFNFAYFLNQYFVQQNYFFAEDWQFGYKELVSFIRPVSNNYEKIIVSNNGSFNQSYIFFLFHLQYDPKKYLKEGGTSSGGFNFKGNKFANFEFRDIHYDKEKERKVLFVGSPGDFPEEYKVIKRIYYPNGNVAMQVVEKD